MRMRRIIYALLVLCLCETAEAQNYLNYQLRLEPVWSRVADALGEPGSVESVEFSNNGKYIVSGTKYDNSVIMWRTSDGAELWRNYTEQEVERVGWSSNDQYVAAVSEDYLITIYDSKSGDVTKTYKLNKAADGLTWSNNGLIMAVGEERTEKSDGTTEGWIRIYDLENDDEPESINFGNTVNELFFTNDDKYLLAVGHGAVKVYNTSNWKLEQTLNPDYYVTFTSGIFSPDAKYVVAVGQGGTSRGTVFLWEWKTGELVKTFNHTGKKIESVTWHPNGQYIAHAGHDPYIYVYRLNDILNNGNDAIPVAHRVWASDHAEYIDFNKDGSFLCSAHQNGLIKLWVWMGEDSSVNSRRHDWVRENQKDNENGN
ncbi:WD40 repeat domain-containing protein [Marinigracilibium pacificum]|uniref:WD40 repeat protein n=1 Tax=Marinigracilibium pacificum TaxID=2729599 RepID=A0A848IZ40_9BACT|nr:hypothetical protein [Marinigracilibium pacificum]NMM47560.1 hypothetical protein [Marinigracilibium pacificum]